MYHYSICLYPLRESPAHRVELQSDLALSEYEAIKLFLEAMKQLRLTSVDFASVVCLNYSFPYHFAHHVSCAQFDRCP